MSTSKHLEQQRNKMSGVEKHLSSRGTNFNKRITDLDKEMLQQMSSQQQQVSTLQQEISMLRQESRDQQQQLSSQQQQISSQVLELSQQLSLQAKWFCAYKLPARIWQAGCVSSDCPSCRIFMWLNALVSLNLQHHAYVSNCRMRADESCVRRS